MANIFIEGSNIETSPEQPEHKEYVIPYTPKDEEFVDNLNILEEICYTKGSFEDSVLKGVRIGDEAYNIRPTEVYTIGEDGGKVFVTGDPGDSNRMVFYAYPDSTQPPLLGDVETSPYLRVYKREIIMNRRSNDEDFLTGYNAFEFVHSFPQINTDIRFVSVETDAEYGNLPSFYILGPAGEEGELTLKDYHLEHIGSSEDPIVGMGWSEGKFYGRKESYKRFLKAIRRFTKSRGGLTPKDAFLRVSFDKEEEEYESNLVISI